MVHGSMVNGPLCPWAMVACSWCCARFVAFDPLAASILRPCVSRDAQSGPPHAASQCHFGYQNPVFETPPTSICRDPRSPAQLQIEETCPGPSMEQRTTTTTKGTMSSSRPKPSARLQFDAEAATAAAKSIEEELCKELFGGGEVEVMTRICLACRKQSDNCKWNSYEVPHQSPKYISLCSISQ